MRSTQGNLKETIQTIQLHDNARDNSHNAVCTGPFAQGHLLEAIRTMTFYNGYVNYNGYERHESHHCHERYDATKGLQCPQEQ